MKVLVTGGLGYIGSHTCVSLLDNNYEVVVLDNLSNSKKSVIKSIEKITKKQLTFYQGDMIDRGLLEEIFAKEKIDAVIDFAAYKAVGESVSKPVEYYTNNVSTVLVLLSVMQKYNVKKIVFSSSATVYGDPERVPIKEDDKIGGTTNPYGTSKLFVEQILKDLYKSDDTWDIAILRYFNPIGAHESGEIGENPNGIPNNLVPYINFVAVGKLDHLNVFGNDYDTPDGTGVRDYIHVVDLALGHLKAIDKARTMTGVEVYNLGTGKGYSVLDIVKAFERVNNLEVKYEITARRPGDIAECYADPTKAKEELGWVATRDLDQMCADSWRFTKNNIK